MSISPSCQEQISCNLEHLQTLRENEHLREINQQLMESYALLKEALGHILQGGQIPTSHLATLHESVYEQYSRQQSQIIQQLSKRYCELVKQNTLQKTQTPSTDNTSPEAFSLSPKKRVQERPDQLKPTEQIISSSSKQQSSSQLQSQSSSVKQACLGALLLTIILIYLVSIKLIYKLD